VSIVSSTYEPAKPAKHTSVGADAVKRCCAANPSTSSRTDGPIAGSSLRHHDLGGVMFWELTGDTDDGELISAIHEGLTPGPD
jgi:hypothetical protein